MTAHLGHRGFSLVEALVAVAIVAIVASLLAPSLSALRESARGAACAMHLRQAWVPMFEFSEANGGLGPAIGWPYGELPNWALVVLQGTSGERGRAVNPTSLYREESVLVCPSERTRVEGGMTRTYAMNAAGHNRAAWNEDPDSYDARPLQVTTTGLKTLGGGGGMHVGIRFDRVMAPARAMLLVDSSVAPQAPELPPSSRTYSVIDLREGAGQGDRLSKRHGGKSFQGLMLDCAVASNREAPAWFRDPLP